jgi:hypothetical protein
LGTLDATILIINPRNKLKIDNIAIDIYVPSSCLLVGGAIYIIIILD